MVALRDGTRIIIVWQRILAACAVSFTVARNTRFGSHRASRSKVFVYQPSRRTKLNDKLEMMKLANPALPVVEIESDDDATGGNYCFLSLNPCALSEPHCGITCMQSYSP